MRKLVRVGGFLAVLVWVASCATSYGPSGFLSGGGYDEKQLDASTYLVRFDGNGNTSKDRVWYLWIYRCAELTREKGFEAFTIAPPPVSSIQPEGTAPVIAPARWSSRPHGGLLKTGSSGYRAPVYIYTPGSTITTWHSRAVVSMFHLPMPIRMTDLLDAQSILDDLHDYVASNGESAPPARELVIGHALVRPAPLRNPVTPTPQLFAPPPLTRPSDTPSAVPDSAPRPAPKTDGV